MGDLRGTNVVCSFTLTVGAAAVSLASASPALANGKMNGKTVRRIVISVTGDSLMWRADGTAPTDTVGHLIEANGFLSLTGANYESMIQNIQFIRVTTNATIFGTAFD